MRSDHCCGYSLKELIIVTAAVVVLIFFVAQQFLHLEVVPTTPVRRLKSEMRNLSVTLEAYRIDNDLYPQAVDENGKIVPYAEDGSTVSSGYTSSCLTTPVSYILTLPTDPFHSYTPPRYKGALWWKEELTMPHRYATNGKDYWIITSYGPDKDEDMPIEEYPSREHAAGDLTGFLIQYGKGTAIEYDATNGTASSGDIVRVGP